MRSIIDEIAIAEQQAEEIRQQAAVKAREAIGFAQADAAAALADADIAEREKTREALDRAGRDGDAAASALLQAMEQEADAVCEKARQRADDAIAYLMKKVTEAS